MNQYETQAIEKLLLQSGHTTADSAAGAEAVVINTCAVTGESARKSRQAARRVKKLNPNMKLCVCGCFPQSDAQAAAALGADYVGGTGDRQKVVDFLNGVEAEKKEFQNAQSLKQFEYLPAGELHGHTRALLKVQDGCKNYCSYCIIPYLRGPSRSLPLDRAVNEAVGLKEKGFPEIVVTGIEISSYGLDIGSSFTELAERICEAAYPARIRLGSIEQSVITGDFISRLKKCDNLCPHFHLSLQSGSRSVLERMGRKYTPGQFAEKVRMLRDGFPGCAITTDLIVGFPGESEEEFCETLEFIRDQGFSAMHIFPYSKREGTRAAAMPGQLPGKVKEERAKRAQLEADKNAKAYLSKQIGGVLEVIFETCKDGVCKGHSQNYLQVETAGGGLKGQKRSVRITGVRDLILAGEII